MFIQNDETNHEPAEPGMLLFYRHRALDAGVIEKFVDCLFAGIAHDARHLDVIQDALWSSGLDVTSSIHCRGPHEQTKTVFMNDFADILWQTISEDTNVRATLASAIGAVLRQASALVPAEHLTAGEVAALYACCASVTPGRHIDEYERYTAYQAHAAFCRRCGDRVEALSSGSPARVGSAKTEEHRLTPHHGDE